MCLLCKWCLRAPGKEIGWEITLRSEVIKICVTEMHFENVNS